MSKESESEIRLRVSLDENRLPKKIRWEATDAGEKSECDAFMLALWDTKENNTLRIDLWTRDFPVEDMKRFFYQNLLSMADTFQKATGETEIMEELKAYCAYFSVILGLKNPEQVE